MPPSQKKYFNRYHKHGEFRTLIKYLPCIHTSLAFSQVIFFICKISLFLIWGCSQITLCYWGGWVTKFVEFVGFHSFYTYPSKLAVFRTEKFGIVNLGLWIWKPRVWNPLLVHSSHYGTWQPLNKKIREFKRTASLEPQVWEGLVYIPK